MGLQLGDNFFLDNLYTFGEVSVDLMNLLENHEFHEEKKEDNFTFLQIFEKAKEVMKSINPDYLEEFSKLVESGKIVADYNIFDVPYLERDYGNSRYGPKDDTIYFGHSFSYDAIPILIHEYFHKLNHSDNIARFVLSEFISIYFELYAYEYLKYHDVKSEELSLSKRLEFTWEDAVITANESFYLYTYNLFGKFDESTYSYIDYSQVSRKDFELELKNKLKQFERIEKNYNEINEEDRINFREHLALMHNGSYKYILGAILAYYSLYFKTPNDVLKLNDVFINNEDISLNDALNIIGVELDDTTVMQMEFAIEKYIKDNNLDRIDKIDRTK